ncbi:Na+/H+ antiporter, subunit MnhC [Thermogladius calderae 1633]|uniref:Na+/H+ antiporter, subunit MnhC n=1 Tax=Thermogladius calderae (strain DSM 22663 / VKM B-2946 / 1633) TaxID=1184251 RepID=I3TEY2_THEC1|nr:NADH-quinone oxidoreductase subunit K [Thermogladius calderae]AFK51320.1 Na+/H+ antiporter, subunit MnhC [Thermogladius calderae 1633]
MFDALTLISLSMVLVGLAAVASTRNVVKVILGLQAMSLGGLLLLSYAFSESGLSARDIVLLLSVVTAVVEVSTVTAVLLYWFRLRTLDTRAAGG